MKFRRFLYGLACFLAITAVLGCSKPEPRREISVALKPGPQDQPKPPIMSTEDRLGLHAPIGGGAEAAHEAFDYDVPEGWVKLPPTQFRIVNLRVEADPETEIYLSVLPGGGGGLLDNVNRWAKQMGAAALAPEAVDGLPKKPFLGQEGVYVEFTGTFTGMGGGEAKENYKLAGLAATTAEGGCFLKMTGPAARVDAELEHFLAFAAGLKPHDHAQDAPAAAVGAPGDADGGGLRWTAPSGWEAAGERQMRLATFVLPGVADFECYVSALGGGGGGVEMNINRWQNQMGQPALTPEQIAALPTIPVLGVDAPRVEISGDFTAMDGGTKPGFKLVGVVCALPGQSIFVKMTGPAEVVTGQTENFVAFCKSLSL